MGDHLRRPRTATSSRRSGSHPSRPGSPPGLSRVLSSQFPDDNSVYHHADGENEDARSYRQTRSLSRRNGSPPDSSDSSSEDEKPNRSMSDEHEVTLEGIKGGIPFDEDVEALPPKLEKKKSARSIKDPNLVRCVYRVSKGTSWSNSTGDVGFSR